MSQCSTNTITYESILRSRAFNDGVKDARQGRPFNYDIRGPEEWHYVRGRHFAQIFTGAIKAGRRIRNEALYEFAMAYQKGVII